MTKYCLDANVFIEGWTKYYSYDLCPQYWEILDQLAQKGTIFAPIEVKKEIDRVEDKLKEWLKGKPYFFKEITLPVQQHMRDIMASYERLVDSSKQRSIADPWVIALALAEDATVVTKETEAGIYAKKIKIPDVCLEMGVPCINDFIFARNIGIKFSAKIG